VAGGWSSADVAAERLKHLLLSSTPGAYFPVTLVKPNQLNQLPVAHNESSEVFPKVPAKTNAPRGIARAARKSLCHVNLREICLKSID